MDIDENRKYRTHGKQDCTLLPNQTGMLEFHQVHVKQKIKSSVFKIEKKVYAYFFNKKLPKQSYSNSILALNSSKRLTFHNFYD